MNIYECWQWKCISSTVLLDWRNGDNVSIVFYVGEILILNTDEAPDGSSHRVDNHLEPGDPHDIAVEFDWGEVGVVRIWLRYHIQFDRDCPEEEAENVIDHAKVVDVVGELALLSEAPRSLIVVLLSLLEHAPVNLQVPVNLVHCTNSFEHVISFFEKLNMKFKIQNQANRCQSQPKIFESVPFLQFMTFDKPLFQILRHSEPEW